MTARLLIRRVPLPFPWASPGRMDRKGRDPMGSSSDIAGIRGRSPVSARLMGVRVEILALPGNSVRISGVPADGDEAPFRALADAGADFALDGNGRAYSAVLPESALAGRLLPEGALVLRAAYGP